MDWQTSNSSLMLEQSMRFLWTKQSAILDNITNVETPGYKAKYVTFEETLRDRLRSVSTAAQPSASYRTALTSVAPQMHETTSESARMDGNSVNATEQAVELSRNAFQLQYVMTTISTDYATLRAAIRG